MNTTYIPYTNNYINKGIKLIEENTSKDKNLYECLNCGCTKEIRKHDAYKKTNSCGNCTNNILTKYGLDRTISTAYLSMLRRCYERTNKGYLTHGLRGIYVDSLWKGNKYDNLSYSYDGFIQFCIWVIKQKYISLKNLTIERKNNDGPYSPLNCDIIRLNKEQTNRSIPTKRTKNASSIYYGVCFNGKNWMATYWDGYKNKNIQNKQNTTELECAFAYDDYIIKNIPIACILL